MMVLRLAMMIAVPKYTGVYFLTGHCFLKMVNATQKLNFTQIFIGWYSIFLRKASATKMFISKCYVAGRDHCPPLREGTFCTAWCWFQGYVDSLPVERCFDLKDVLHFTKSYYVNRKITFKVRLITWFHQCDFLISKLQRIFSDLMVSLSVHQQCFSKRI